MHPLDRRDGEDDEGNRGKIGNDDPDHGSFDRSDSKMPLPGSSSSFDADFSVERSPFAGSASRQSSASCVVCLPLQVLSALVAVESARLSEPGPSCRFGLSPSPVGAATISVAVCSTESEPSVCSFAVIGRCPATVSIGGRVGCRGRLPSDPRSVAIGRFPSAIWCLSSTFERDALSVVGGSPHTVGIAGIARAKDALEFVETVLEPIDSCDGPVSPLLDGLVHGFDGADESVECVDSSLEIADPSLVCVDPFGESREILGEDAASPTAASSRSPSTTARSTVDSRRSMRSISLMASVAVPSHLNPDPNRVRIGCPNCGYHYRFDR